MDLILFLLMPVGLERLGWISPLLPRAWFVLGAAAIGVILQTVLGDLISEESGYHRHSYDFCIITVGASLSAIAAQLITDQNLFPGLTGTSVMKMVLSIRRAPSSTPTPADNVIVLVSVFGVSCVASLLTAYISKAISDPTTRFKNGPSMINFLVGFGLFGWYILILVTGG